MYILHCILFCRAILKGLNENNILCDIDLNISNNEVITLIFLHFSVDKFVFALIMRQFSDIVD